MPNNGIQIQYSRFNEKLSDQDWNMYFHSLPEAIKKRINRCQRWQDRHAVLFGRLLLLECLKKYGYPSDSLHNILFDRYGRPYLYHNIDFNISHSGEYVVCSITDEGKVGIDIEKIKPIDLADYEQYMTSEQLGNIKKDANDYNKFYAYWTIKESVLKADGRGLLVPLENIIIEGEKAILFDNKWYLNQINIGIEYCCYLASKNRNPKIDIKEHKF